MPLFERPHHRLIARVIDSLDDTLLRTDHCWFGGGTAIALRHGEYRESVDIDFMVSNMEGYRDLRQRLIGARTLAAVTRDRLQPMALEREARADQYGIRMFVIVDEVPIKCEIVHEGRISFDEPGRRDRIGQVSTLSLIDMAASKLLANADRWLDTSTACDKRFARRSGTLAGMHARAVHQLAAGCCSRGFADSRAQA